MDLKQNQGWLTFTSMSLKAKIFSLENGIAVEEQL